MIQHVGVIGLGTIGEPIAERIVAAGYRVAVYDIRPEPVAQLVRLGAAACACPAEVAQRSDLVLSLVASLIADSGCATGHDNPAL